MVIRLLLFLVMVAATGAFAFVAYTSLVPREEVSASAPVETPPEPARATVLVAARAVAAGTLLRAEDVQGAEFRVDAMPAEAMPDTPDMRARLLGGMVRQPLAPGQTLTEAMVLQANDRGFLAAILAPGHRAIAVGVDPTTGNAGLIWPGDRVDLVLTQVLPDQNTAIAQRVVGETVLQDVRVVAVDQKLVQGARGETAEGDAVARTVTLEVTPDDATRVAVAERLGRLALVLRAAEEPAVAGETEEPRQPLGGVLLANLPAVPARKPAPAPDQSRPVWAGDVSPALNSPGPAAGASSPAAAPTRTITVINGATTSEASF